MVYGSGKAKMGVPQYCERANEHLFCEVRLVNTGFAGRKIPNKRWVLLSKA
jgi:hypothetical protein